MDKEDVKSVINYKEENYPSLPSYGWLKRCYNKKCRAITSSYIIIDYYWSASKKYYMCPLCIKDKEYDKFRIGDKYNIKSFFSNKYGRL